MYTKEDIIYKFSIPEDLVTDELVKQINAASKVALYPILDSAKVVGYKVVDIGREEASA
jgi:hypothetical protein